MPPSPVHRSGGDEGGRITQGGRVSGSPPLRIPARRLPAAELPVLYLPASAATNRAPSTVPSPLAMSYPETALKPGTV